MNKQRLQASNSKTLFAIYMYHPFGYGGGMLFSSNYLLLIGIPLLIGLWAQFRVSERLQEMGRSARELQHHRRGSGA